MIPRKHEFNVVFCGVKDLFSPSCSQPEECPGLNKDFWRRLFGKYKNGDFEFYIHYLPKSIHKTLDIKTCKDYIPLYIKIANKFLV